MSTNTEKEEVMTIEEVADGTAVVELPPSIPSPDADDEQKTQNAADDDDDGSDEADENARQAEMAVGGAIDADAEALREQKRLKRHRRKEYHRQVEQEKNLKLDMLTRQNQELVERLAVLERKSSSSELARLNSAIDEQKNRIAFAKAKISEATSTGNGELLTSAQEMWFEARRNAEALENIKKRATAPQRQQTIQQPHPSVTRHAQSWMERHSWYDPQGKDADSKVALAIDDALGNEGWDAASPEYWEELDNRLQRYLPHRYTVSVDGKSNRRPRNVVTGSGRESSVSRGGDNQFILTREQVNAMKEAGMWDDPKKRAKMVAKYAEFARSQRNIG